MRLSSVYSVAFVVVSVATAAACAPNDPVPQPSDNDNARSIAQAISGTCTNGEADGTFADHCLLAGGSETRCSGGTAMCCRSCGAGEGCTTHCFDRTEDVREDPKGSRPPHVRYTFAGSLDTVKLK